MKIIHIRWIIISVFLILCVSILLYSQLFLQAFIFSLLPNSIPLPLPPLADYPTQHITVSPVISAEAALVMDADSNVVLYSKNANFQFSPASTTKLMTALVAFDYFQPQHMMSIKVATTEGSLIGFIPGQQTTFENLLYAMFLPSANDAAQNIAANIPGGEPAFVEKMNEKAQALHLTHTHFADPAGLLDDDTYTTPFELLQLASIVIKNPVIATIMQTKYKIISMTDGTQYELKNLNQLLGLYGINGVKTGHTEGAKDVLVTSLKKDGHTILIVVMKSDDRFADTLALIQDVTNTVTYSPIVD